MKKEHNSKGSDLEQAQNVVVVNGIIDYHSSLFKFSFHHGIEDKFV
jgi:hypothetical protein